MYLLNADAAKDGGDRAEELALLRRMLRELEAETAPEHADRRARLAAAIRGVVAKYA